MERDILYTPDGVEITVDAKWLHNLCRTIAREDAEAGGYDYDEASADAIYENMSEETTLDVLKEAFSDVAASKIASEDATVMVSISELGTLQKSISDFERELGRKASLVVRLQEDRYESDEDQFEILINGIIYSNYLSISEADDIVNAFIKGMQMAQMITVDTPAGKVIAGTNFDPGAPGIYMELVPKGHGEHIDLVTTEVKLNPDLRHDGEAENDLALYIWGDVSDESWTERKDYRRSDILEVLEEVSA